MNDSCKKKFKKKEIFLFHHLTWIMSPYWSDSERSCSWWVLLTSWPTKKTTLTFLMVSVSWAQDSLMLYRASKLGTELQTMTRRKGWASLEELEARHTSGLRILVSFSGPMSSRALRDWFAGQTNARGPETVCLNIRESLCNYYITFGHPFR